MDEIDKKLEELIKELKKSGKPEDKEAYHSLVEVRIKRYQHLIENLKEKAECAGTSNLSQSTSSTSETARLPTENVNHEDIRSKTQNSTSTAGLIEEGDEHMEEVLPNPEMQDSTVDTSATLVHSAGTSTASDTKQHQDDDNTDKHSDMRVDELTTAKDQETSASSQILEDAIVIPAAAELPDDENKSEEQKSSIMEASKPHEDSGLHPMTGTPPLALSVPTQSCIDESSSLPNTAEKIQEENPKNELFRQSPVAYTNDLLTLERRQSAMNTMRPTPSHDTSSMSHEDALSTTQSIQGNSDNSGEINVNKSGARTDFGIDQPIYRSAESAVNLKNDLLEAEDNGSLDLASTVFEAATVVKSIVDGDACAVSHIKSVLLSELPIRRLTEADIALLGLKQRNSTVAQHSKVPQASSKSAVSSVEPVESLGPVSERYSHALNVSKNGTVPTSACTEQRKRRATEEIRSAVFKRNNLCSTIATKITSSTISYNLDPAYVQSLRQRQHPLTLEAAVSAMHSGLPGPAGEEAAETQPSTSTTTSTNSVPPSKSKPMKIVKQNVADAHQQLKSNALYRSACDGQDEMVRQLIDAGHPIDTDYHATPLTAAFMRGHIKCMQYLLHAGADYQRLLKNSPSCVKEDVYEELMNFKQFIDYYMERYVIPSDATTLLTLHIPANDLQRRMISFSLKEEDLHRELFIYVFVITTSETKGVVKSIVANYVPAEKHKNSTKIFRVLNLKKENSIEIEFDHCGRRGQILGLSVLAK